MLRTVQSIPPPPNSIVPALKMRRRGSERRSSMWMHLLQTSLNSMKMDVKTSRLSEMNS